MEILTFYRCKNTSGCLNYSRNHKKYQYWKQDIMIYMNLEKEREKTGKEGLKKRKDKRRNWSDCHSNGRPGEQKKTWAFKILKKGQHFRASNTVLPRIEPFFSIFVFLRSEEDKKAKRCSRDRRCCRYKLISSGGTLVCVADSLATRTKLKYWPTKAKLKHQRLAMAAETG